jgi:AcrR family transcriptional regulator
MNDTENKTPEGEARKPGRPRGRTGQGEESRQGLYAIAIEMIEAKGYEATTLRDIAQKAGVSPGLLYKYFPSKRAVVLELYDRLSEKFAKRAAHMPSGSWRHRFLFALQNSMSVIGPNRNVLAALIPVLIGNEKENLFAPETAFSRIRVQSVFQEAVEGAADAPKGDDAEILGRMLYVLHLAIVLNMLLDKSPKQRATAGMITLLEKALPLGALALRLKAVRRLVRFADSLLQESLFGEKKETVETKEKK